jgi:hypothetical protein
MLNKSLFAMLFSTHNLLGKVKSKFSSKKIHENPKGTNRMKKQTIWEILKA